MIRARLIKEEKILSLKDIHLQITSNLQGWLFQFYLLIDNYNSYDIVNKRTKEYKNNIIKALSVEDIENRNNLVSRL